MHRRKYQDWCNVVGVVGFAFQAEAKVPQVSFCCRYLTWLWFIFLSIVHCGLKLIATSRTQGSFNNSCDIGWCYESKCLWSFKCQLSKVFDPLIFMCTCICFIFSPLWYSLSDLTTHWENLYTYDMHDSPPHFAGEIFTGVTANCGMEWI